MAGRSIQERFDSGPRPFTFPDPAVNPTNYEENTNLHPNPQPRDWAHSWRGTDPTSQRLRQYRPILVTTWMRKGGVGKSNCTYMLGNALARTGTKTMMVDADSQQDLSELTFRALAESAGFSDIDLYLRTKLPGNHTVATLADAVRFTFGENPINQNVPQEAGNSLLLTPHPFAVPDNGWNNLFFVPGGYDFEEVERTLQEGITSCATPNARRNVPGSLFHAIWRAGFRCNAEVILLDLNPALGSTNEILLLHSDYFITPCEVNKLSEKNLVTIASTIKQWYSKYQDAGCNTNLRDITRGAAGIYPLDTNAELPLPEIEPRYLGMILSKYEAYHHARKRDRLGKPKNTSETFKGHARVHQASQMLEAARSLNAALTPPDVDGNNIRLTPANPGQLRPGFAVIEDVFTAPGPGLGVYRHPTGSEFLPQFLQLARIRQTSTMFQAAISVYGKPISYLEEDELEAEDFGTYYSNKEDAKEEIAHLRRVYEDLARFIVNLPKPPPYNFVLDPSRQLPNHAHTLNQKQQFLSCKLNFDPANRDWLFLP